MFLGESRILNEFSAIARDKIPGVEVKLKSTRLWHFVMCGPKGSVFYSGRYHGTLAIPEAYPNVPPVVEFFTPNGRYMPHHNLCLFGHDCWLPSYTLRNVLVSLRQNFAGPAIIGDGIMAVVEKNQAKTLAAESLAQECELCGKHSEIQLREDPEDHTSQEERKRPDTLHNGTRLEEEEKSAPVTSVQLATSPGASESTRKFNREPSVGQASVPENRVPEPDHQSQPEANENGDNAGSEVRRPGEWWYEVRMSALFELGEEIQALKQDRSLFVTLKLLRLTLLYVEKAILIIAYRPEVVAAYCIFSILLMCGIIVVLGFMLGQNDLSSSCVTAIVIHFIAVPLIIFFKILHTLRMCNPTYTLPSICTMYLEAVSQIFFFWTSVAIAVYTIHNDEAWKLGIVFTVLFAASQFVRYLALAMRFALFPLFLVPFLVEYILRVTCCKPWQGVLAHEVRFEARLANEKCVICQGGLQQDQRLIGLSCHPNHIFHHDCIVAWIRQKKECPYCKALVDKTSHPSLNVPGSVPV